MPQRVKCFSWLTSRAPAAAASSISARVTSSQRQTTVSARNACDLLGPQRHHPAIAAPVRAARHAPPQGRHRAPRMRPAERCRDRAVPPAPRAGPPPAPPPRRARRRLAGDVEPRDGGAARRNPAPAPSRRGAVVVVRRAEQPRRLGRRHQPMADAERVAVEALHRAGRGDDAHALHRPCRPRRGHAPAAAPARARGRAAAPAGAARQQARPRRQRGQGVAHSPRAADRPPRRPRAPAVSTLAATAEQRPAPATTTRRPGSMPCALIRIVAAASPITPGSVQPGKGMMRSCVPRQRISARASASRARLRRAHPGGRARPRCPAAPVARRPSPQTRQPVRTSAPLVASAARSASPVAPVGIGRRDETGRRRAIDLTTGRRAFLQQHGAGATARGLGCSGHARRAAAKHGDVVGPLMPAHHHPGAHGRQAGLRQLRHPPAPGIAGRRPSCRRRRAAIRAFAERGARPPSAPRPGSRPPARAAAPSMLELHLARAGDAGDAQAFAHAARIAALTAASRSP